MTREPADILLDLYPKIYLACHKQHTMDHETGRILTAKQVALLEHLDLQSPVTLKKLAAHLGVRPATACLAVDRLESQGYVRRTRSTSDRREVCLLLTPAGLAVCQDSSVLDKGRVRKMLAAMDPNELQAGLEGLALIAHAANNFMEIHGHGWDDLHPDPTSGEK